MKLWQTISVVAGSIVAILSIIVLTFTLKKNYDSAVKEEATERSYLTNKLSRYDERIKALESKAWILETKANK